MTEETGAAAPTDTEVAKPAATESEQATPAVVQPEQEAPPENAETEQQEDSQESEARRKLSRSQRQQRKIARLSSMLAEQAAKIEELNKATPSGPQAPREEDINGDYFAYQRALNKFDTEQAVGAVLEKIAPKDTKPDVRQLDRLEAVQELQERVDAASKHLTDFEPSLAELHKRVGNLSDAVIEEVTESDKGELILYHLSKNLDLAESINKMSARDVAREIGRLEAKVSLPNPRKQTSAPPPMSQPKGGATPSRSESELAKSEDASELIRLWREKKRA
jgi:uncharacterized coiled-coil protein SlyX